MSRLDLAAILAGVVAVAHAAAGEAPEWQLWCLTAGLLYLASLVPRR